MSLVGWFRPKGKNGYGYNSTASEVCEGIDLLSRTIVITGVNSGLGLESARVLANQGATIYGLARSEEKARRVLSKLGHNHRPFACDLSEPLEVVRCAEEISKEQKIDAVVCNAGIMALPQRRVKHGQELQFLTNHIGHFLLVTSLLPRLSESGRVVVVASGAHRWTGRRGIRFDDISFEQGYRPNLAYGQSKLANILFARSLSKRFEGSDRVANALHPGVIPTKLDRHMPLVVRTAIPLVASVGMKTIPQGAATQCFLAAHPLAAEVSGQYFADCNIATPHKQAEDMKMAERLWQRSEEIIESLV